MADNCYYDGTKLLSMSDINGDKPEIFICTSNRSAGKTTYFSRLCVNRYLDKGEKFCLVYRYNYELDGCADKFFKDIKSLFFQSHEMTNKRQAAGAYHELYLDGDSCGYAISLNNADQLKKYSHFLSDVVRMMFDEFQSETGHYCSKEIEKLLSVHTSIARGNHKQVRYVPIYMISNPVSIINPYYCELGISSRLKSDTKFLKGVGFVLEQGFNEAASKAQKESAFNRAFASNQYVSYSAENVYLNDNLSFIEKPESSGHYFCTIKCDGLSYGVREYPQLGIVYCDNRPDMTYPVKIAVTTDDHQINYIMLKRSDSYIQTMKQYFMHGAFRFKDLKCKEAILKAISFI